MDDKNNILGFAGLAGLASDISDDGGDVFPAESPSAPKEPARDNADGKTSDAPRTGQVAHGEESRDRTGTYAGLAIAFCIIVFGLYLLFASIDSPDNTGRQTTNNAPLTVPAVKQSYEPPKRNSAPAASTDSGQVVALRYEKPPVGTGIVLSVPQICWCKREAIRIDSMRGVIDSKQGTDDFNRIVDDYNRRCSSYQYRPGSLERALAMIEAQRGRIAADAVNDALDLNSRYRSGTPEQSDREPPWARNMEAVREVQELLTQLGYKPGTIDGQFGKRTEDAIKSFQRDSGNPDVGLIDQELVNQLRGRKYTKDNSVSGRPSPPEGIKQQPDKVNKNIVVQPTLPAVQPLPQNGKLSRFSRALAEAPFEIVTRSGQGHYFVKLVDSTTGRDVLSVFVRSGQKVEVEVPYGIFELRYAAGDTWYGEKHLFGKDTVYSRSDELFHFQLVGTEIQGFTVELFLQQDGNLKTRNIKAEDF